MEQFPSKQQQQQPKMMEKPPRSCSPETTTGIIHHDGVMKFIMFGCVAIGVVVNLLPYKYRDGSSSSPVPNVIFFKEMPTTTFHTFIISVMFAFSGAFSALLLTKSKLQLSNYERFCRCYALISGAVAVTILVNAAVRSATYQGLQIMES